MELETLKQLIVRANALDRAGRHVEADALDREVRVIESQNAAQNAGNALGSFGRNVVMDTVVKPAAWGIGEIGQGLNQVGQFASGLWNGVTNTPATPPSPPAPAAAPAAAPAPVMPNPDWYAQNKTTPEMFQQHVTQWANANGGKQALIARLTQAKIPADVIAKATQNMA